MKITVCGSIIFFGKMQEIGYELEKMGHEIILPPEEVKNKEGNLISVAEYYAMRKAAADDNDWILEKKGKAMKNHFANVAKADAILVLNYEKNGIPNYVGANTFLEMGIAFHYQRKIFLLNSIPDISFKEEILAMKPIVIVGDLSLIKP